LARAAHASPPPSAKSECAGELALEIEREVFAGFRFRGQTWDEALEAAKRGFEPEALLDTSTLPRLNAPPGGRKFRRRRKSFHGVPARTAEFHLSLQGVRVRERERVLWHARQREPPLEEFDATWPWWTTSPNGGT